MGERRGSDRVRVPKSPCPDRCARKAAVVALPGFCWYRGATLADADRILAEHPAVRVPAPDSDIKERP